MITVFSGPFRIFTGWKVSLGRFLQRPDPDKPEKKRCRAKAQRRKGLKCIILLTMAI